MLHQHGDVIQEELEKAIVDVGLCWRACYGDGANTVYLHFLLAHAATMCAEQSGDLSSVSCQSSERLNQTLTLRVKRAVRLDRDWNEQVCRQGFPVVFFCTIHEYTYKQKYSLVLFPLQWSLTPSLPRLGWTFQCIQACCFLCMKFTRLCT